MTTIQTLREWVMSRPKTFIGIVAAVAVAAAAVVTVVAWPHDDGFPGDAAFSYRGTVVTVASLQERMHVLSALYGVAEPTDPAAQDKYWRAAAQADAMSMVLDNAGATAGVVVTDQKANSLLQQMAQSQLQGDPTTALAALLEKFGVSKADVLAEIKRQEEIALLFQQVTKSASKAPSTAEASAYFQTHAADFAVPEQRHLLNIVVSSQTQAQEVVNAAKSTDFGSLATKYSLDSATRSKGGDLGTVAASTLDAAYAKAAFGAATGGIFGPVQTQSGWNVGKVVAIVASRSVTFDSVRTNVIATMQSNNTMTAWKAWLSNQLTTADVRYAARYKPADPLQLPTVNVPTGSPS